MTLNHHDQLGKDTEYTLVCPKDCNAHTHARSTHTYAHTHTHSSRFVSLALLQWYAC